MPAKSTPKPRLRFAPSPTGPLHIGGARTAIYNWAAARAMGGTFILRIEDTDQVRSTQESLDIILQAFQWLGVDWDEGPGKDGDCGPYFQAQRLDLYGDYAQQLLQSGHAYHCYCTPEEVEQGRQALQAAGKSPMYDRRCRDLTPEQAAAKQAAGLKSSIRFRMPLDEVWQVEDLGKGQVDVNLRELDDWVMVRAGGMPLYNFACVVDDLLMEITHVVRGEEHFMNGVKQGVMFRALGKEPPRYAHIPLILGKNGKKLSKREASTNMLDYRDQGYPADALFNYIALLGWNYSGEQDIFSRQQMVDKFQIGDVGKSGSKFDEEKLQWMCGDYIRRMPVAELSAAVQPFLLAAGAVPEAAFGTHPDLVANMLRCYQERIKLYSEMPDCLAYYFAEQLEMDAAAQKNLNKQADAKKWLLAYAELLQQSDLPPSYPADRGAVDSSVTLPSPKEGDSPPRALEEQARKFADGMEVKFGHLVHPVRAALTGTNKGPGLFDIVYLLGKERCVERLRRAAESLD